MSVAVIARMLIGAIGLIFLYLAAFTYESTDHRIESKLEDLWLALSYLGPSPAGLANRFFLAALTVMNWVADRAFGARLWSTRALAVALCCAFGALVLSPIALSLFAPLAGVDFRQLYSRAPIPVPALLPTGAAAFAVAMLPAVQARLRWVTYVVAGWMLATLAATAWVILADRPEAAWLRASIEDPGPLLGAATFVLLYGIGVVLAMRYGVRRLVEPRADRRDALLVGGMLLFAVLAFAANACIAMVARSPRGQLTVWMSRLLRRDAVRDLVFLVGGPSSLWGLGLLVLLGISLVVMLHLVLWPMVRFILMAESRDGLPGSCGPTTSGTRSPIWASPCWACH